MWRGEEDVMDEYPVKLHAGHCTLQYRCDQCNLVNTCNNDNNNNNNNNNEWQQNVHKWLFFTDRTSSILSEEIW